MDMGKCTSCILYIKQNPTTYKDVLFFFLGGGAKLAKRHDHDTIQSRPTVKIETYEPKRGARVAQ
jgi:hypothetical protein